jgi:histidyl-tRNA synthetase
VQPRSGKFGAQLGRLEAAGFTSLIHVKADTTEPEERPLGK